MPQFDFKKFDGFYKSSIQKAEEAKKELLPTFVIADQGALIMKMGESLNQLKDDKRFDSLREIVHNAFVELQNIGTETEPNNIIEA